MADQKQTFDVGLLINDLGLKFSRVDDAGQPFVLDPEGNEKALDLPRLATDIGVDLTKVKTEYNSPSDPIQISPVSFADRAKLSMGNTKGSVQYLKQNFEDAMFDQEQGMVVKKNGAWHRVDPKFLGNGDAWQKTKELAKDVLDLGDIAINAVTSSIGAAGGAVAGFGGMIAGAGAGGTASGLIRTSLGRIAGTYDATPEEQLMDVGLETIFTMGGQAIGMGAKPGLDKLGKAIKNIAETSSDASKALFTRAVGSLAKIQPEAMETVVDQFGEVGNAMMKARSAVGPKARWEAGKEFLVKENIDLGEKLLTLAKEELPRQFGKAVDDVVEAAGQNKLVVNLREFADGAISKVEELGMGYIQKGKNGQSLFVPFTERQIGIRTSQGLAVEPLSAESAQAVKKIVTMLDNFGRAGQLKGKGAAKALVAFEKLLNNLTDEAFSGSNAQLQRIVTTTKSGWKNQVKQTFKDAGLGDAWNARSKLYEEYGGAVTQARNLLKQDTTKGIEALTNQYVSTAGKNVSAKSVMGDLIGLVGKEGEKLGNQIKVNHAASQFIKTTPAMGWFQGSATAAATGFTLGTGGIGAGLTIPATAAMLTASTPKAVFKGIGAAKAVLPYANMALDTLKFMPKQGVELMKKNPEAMEIFLRSVAVGVGKEQEFGQKLQEGIKSRVK